MGGVKIIYLAGLISTEKPESIKWRKEAEALLSLYRRVQIQVLSRMRGKSALDKNSADGGVTMNGLTEHDVILRDYGDVSEADVIS